MPFIMPDLVYFCYSIDGPPGFSWPNLGTRVTVLHRKGEIKVLLAVLKVRDCPRASRWVQYIITELSAREKGGKRVRNRELT